MDNFTQVHESSSGVPRLDVLINSTHRPQVRHVHGGHKFAGHVRLENKGGETHTFTRVDQFGGGFKARLNGLTGNPVPAAECAQVLPDGSLAPQPESPTNQFVEAGKTEAGPAAGSSALPLGVSRWECCIHPWMRMVVVVHEHED